MSKLESNALNFIEELKEHLASLGEGDDASAEIICRKLLKYGFIKQDGDSYVIDSKANADGCIGCKYQSKDQYEMPCLHCKRGNDDHWTNEHS